MQRERRDARAEFRTSTKVFKAAMESVDIAQARVDMWIKAYDAYKDEPFWTHSLTKDVTIERPGLHHYLPPTFRMPPPPKPLPEGVSLDTSSDESEHAFRKTRKVTKGKSKTTADKSKKKRGGKKKSDVDSDPSSDSNDSSISSDSSESDSTSQKSSISSVSESSSVQMVRVQIDDTTDNVPRVENKDEYFDPRAPREYSRVKERNGLGMSMPTSVDKDGNVVLADAGSISGQPIRIQSDTDSVGNSSKHSVTSFNYGPDSLRAALPGRVGLPVFQDVPKDEEYEMTELERRVQEAREYLNKRKKRTHYQVITVKISM